MIQILVTGNSVRSDEDIEHLTRKISAAVERSINTKASLLNFRAV